MGKLTKMQEDYLKALIEEEKAELAKNHELIEQFKNICKLKGLILQDENFKYIGTIGIVAVYPNILSIINPNINIDKEGLVSVLDINRYYQRKRFANGLLYTDNHVAMAHPFFRRNFYEYNNFAPRFIEHFWELNDNNIEAYIALDFNKVRIEVKQLGCLELDVWYGANFNEEINKIPDGIVKLRPPLDIDDSFISTFFGDAYSLDIKWETDSNIKSFQAEEFKTERVKINFNGKCYYPVRYIHAEYDLNNNYFRHFDGAIHLYTEDEYFLRRESDFNYNSKTNNQIKSSSIKLFKLNGIVHTDTWIKFSSHFFTANPLIIEYFEKKYPKHVIEVLEKIRNH